MKPQLTPLTDDPVLIEARTKRYLVARRAEAHLAPVYFQWCEARREPYVFARIRRRNARIILDMTPTGRQLSVDAQADIETILCEGESFRPCWIGPIVCGNDCVPSHRVETVAAALYAIALRSLEIGMGLAV